MFLVLAAALFVMANVAVKVRPWPMPPYLENIYKEFFSRFNRCMIEKLPSGVQYGCNHIHTKGTTVVFMLTLCFFRTTLS
ncbi:hypothetical protein OSTOST_15286 [Ostertagia ostertagi]